MTPVLMPIANEMDVNVVQYNVLEFGQIECNTEYNIELAISRPL